MNEGIHMKISTTVKHILLISSCFFWHGACASDQPSNPPEKSKEQTYINAVTQMRAILGIPVESSATAASPNSLNHTCVHHEPVPLPETIRRDIVDGKDQTVVAHYTEHRSALSAQNEDGLTPALRAASHGHVGMFEGLTQLECQNQHAMSERIYAQPRNNHIVGCILDFEYTKESKESAENSASPEEQVTKSKRPWRSYFVHAAGSRSFSCYPFKAVKSNLTELQTACSAGRRCMVLGIPAYKLACELEARAVSCPLVIAVDHPLTRRKINEKHEEHQRAIKAALETTIGTWIISDLRTQIQQYVSNEFPSGQKNAIVPASSSKTKSIQ